MAKAKGKSGDFHNKRIPKNKTPRTSQDNLNTDGDETLFFGRNVVLELIKSGRQIDRIFVQSGEREGSINLIVAKALERKIPVIDTEKQKLDQMAEGENHQGVAARASFLEYKNVVDILDLAKQKGEPPFVIICDSINDPHNLGAIIRTAECAGAHGIIIPKRRSVSVTSAVAKASAGAVFHLPIAKVTNLNNTIRELKQGGVWVFAVDMEGTPYFELDYTGPCALVLGGEGSGVSRLLRENSDFVSTIPQYGSINSLNVSAAGAVVFFEVAKQRNKAKPTTI